MAPFKAVYGRDPRRIDKYVLDTDDPTDPHQMLQQRDTILTQLKANLLKAQQNMKRNAHKKRRQIEFKEGDMVFVKLQPYRQNSLALRKKKSE